MVKFAQILKRELDKKRVTISGVSRDAGCSRQHLYDIVNGHTDITLQLAARIADCCGLEIELKKKRKKVAKQRQS